MSSMWCGPSQFPIKTKFKTIGLNKFFLSCLNPVHVFTQAHQLG